MLHTVSKFDFSHSEPEMLKHPPRQGACWKHSLVLRFLKGNADNTWPPDSWGMIQSNKEFWKDNFKFSCNVYGEQDGSWASASLKHGFHRLFGRCWPICFSSLISVST